MAPPAPLDRPTLEAALAGDEHARAQLVAAVSRVVNLVLAKRPQPDTKRQHERHLGVWRHLMDGDCAVLREWDPRSGTFEQHVADVVVVWLDIAMSQDVTGIAWTPALVNMALDAGGELKELLARDVLDIVWRYANQVLHSHRHDGTSVAPEDMSQSFAAKLFDKRAAILRAWDPARGRTSLHSYLSLISRRYFKQLMHKGKGGEALLVHDAAEFPAPRPEPAILLQRMMILEACAAALDEGERELLEQVYLGLTAEEGAARLGCTPNTYNQRKHRLVKKLRETMRNLEGPEP